MLSKEELEILEKIREEKGNPHNFIFKEKASVISWFYINQEVIIDDIIDIVEAKDWSIVIVSYRCIIDLEDWNKIARIIQAKDLQPIDE